MQSLVWYVMRIFSVRFNFNHNGTRGLCGFVKLGYYGEGGTKDRFTSEKGKH